MSAEVKVNSQDFNRVMELCLKHTERTYSQFVNSRAFFVAKKAMEETEKADADKIVFQLAGNVRVKLGVSRKTGQRTMKRQYDVLEGSLAARIINAKLKADGKKMIFGKEMMQAVKRMIGARLRAVAFIRSGWIYAIKTLAPLVGGGKGASIFGNARMTGAAKGYAKPASAALSSIVQCEIGNTALLQGKHSSPMKVGLKGLEKAMAREAQEALNHLREKLGPTFKGFSAS